ncbi:methyltransferase domain-containing protein [Streptomyces sp. SID7760]|nr:methyltransferase domain-containing protein [Streptomyces sp. SID7760]
MSQQAIEQITQAWEEADPRALHPVRAVSEEAYLISGLNQSALLSTVLPPGRVVDFGCGDGRLAIPLHDLGIDVMAVDGAQAMLDRLAAAAPGLPSALSDGTDLVRVLGEPADSLIAIGVLGEYDPESAALLVECLRAAVRTGGLLVLDWPTAAEHGPLLSRIGLVPLDACIPWHAFLATEPTA